MQHLKKEPTLLIQITHEKAAMLNQYEKNGLKRVHPELYSLLQTLDTMAGAYNKVWLQRYEEAMADFSTVDLLPMKK